MRSWAVLLFRVTDGPLALSRLISEHFRSKGSSYRPVDLFLQKVFAGWQDL